MITRTVKEVIEELKRFPEDAKCFAYEGEPIDDCYSYLVILDTNKEKTLGFVKCPE